MSKHTPGPWIVDADGDVSPEGTRDVGICHLMPIDGGPERYRYAEVTTANAKLIASAPKLLEALESIRTYANDTLSGRADGGPDDRAWQRECVIECRNRARDAIAKATA